jgi:NCAIR mutase (PurE)-related protein
MLRGLSAGVDGALPLDAAGVLDAPVSVGADGVEAGAEAGAAVPVLRSLIQSLSRCRS